MTSMGIEREVKLEILGDPSQVEELLRTSGFEHLDDCIEVDTYYTHPCRDLATTDEALRFRRRKCSSGGKHVVTYKGPRLSREDVKSRFELEIEISEREWSLLRILVEKLGFMPLINVTKRRKIYVNNGLKAYVDELMGVGFFLEIEAMSNEATKYLIEILVSLQPLTRIVHETYLEICLNTRKCI